MPRALSSRQANAPVRMTRAYNEAMALSKVDIAPLDKLTSEMLASIARTHRVNVAVLRARLDERLARG